jgi:DNA-binding CsgD family transcriptional regulator
MLLDRVSERAAISRLLEQARSGRSGALVVRGEPGVGKTALLADAIESAPDFWITRAVGVESEMELAFAGLHQLCAPMLDHVEELPAPQREAIGVAFGLKAGPAPTGFLVGLAVLNLLAEVAAERPVLCIVDDAHWLDSASAQALGFVARRLLAESVVLIIATREPGKEFTGLPELPVAGLRHDAADELLGRVANGPLDEQVRERLIAETRGNPLALLELPRGLTRAELAAGFGVEPGLPARIEDSFQRRLADLSDTTRRFLLVAAAEPLGEPELLCAAAERLGLGQDAMNAVEADGLLEVGDRVTFRHPLVRSAVYRAAAPGDRRAVHRALAEATDPTVDPDRRAWHRARAATKPDEDVAADLERSADRASARGGCAASAAFLELSAALTPDRSKRAARALAAARAKHQAGAFDAALSLLAKAEAGPLGEFERVQAELLRGQVAFASNRGNDAPPLLLNAARRLERFDPKMARDTYLEAVAAAIFASRLAVGASLHEVAEAACRAPAPQQPPRAADLLLDGLATYITRGPAEGMPTLKRAVRAFRSDEVPRADRVHWLWLACHAAGLAGDFPSWEALCTAQVELARDGGSVVALPIAYSTLAEVRVLAGEFAMAAELVAEVDAITETTGSSIAPYAALALAVLRGRESEAMDLIEAGTADVRRRGEGKGLTFVRWAAAVLDNSLGRYSEALAAAQIASEDSHVLWFSNWSRAELVEAAARTGAPEVAAAAFQQLAQHARAAGTDWALGIEARSHALLLGDGDAAEPHYLNAIDHLERTRLRVELGRTRLVYGEWLRRRRRRRDARTQLGRAFEIFDGMGAAAFAERARIELRATGVATRARAAETRDVLTAQEAQIARLAGQGSSNAEIAAQLFLSPATIAYHLRKVFAKLGIGSRGQLSGVLARPVGYQPTGSDYQQVRMRDPRTST